MSSFCNSYFPNVIPSTSMTENNSFVFRANLEKKQNPLKQKKNCRFAYFPEEFSSKSVLYRLDSNFYIICSDHLCNYA